MGQVSVSSSVLIDAEPETVLPAVADCQAVRPKMLSPHYSGYRVLEGGQRAGTVATWKLQGNKSRVRDVEANPLGRSALAIAGALVDAWNRPLPRGKWKSGRPAGHDRGDHAGSRDESDTDRPVAHGECREREHSAGIPGWNA